MSLSYVDALSYNYYDKTCPNFEMAITNVVKKAMANDNTIPTALLQIHFHDCFIRGCDGSLLLNSTAETDGPPNISLHHTKKAVEELCLGVVSCADILALAARDGIALSGGPRWEVPKGRLDGRISIASDTRQLPGPVFNISQLQQSFSQRGLSLDDLVALSGGHSLGFTHCFSLQNRIHNFASFAASLRSTCPMHKEEFFEAFTASMIRMSSLTGGQEVRLDCRVVR